MASRFYKSSLRPVVVATSLITAGWTLAWAIGAFQEVNVDKDHGQPKFATFSITLGALYAAVCVGELFGVIAATMQTLALVRLFSWLSVINGLVIIAAAFLRTVIHFVFKSDLLSECFDIARGQDVVVRWGIWGPTIREKLSDDDARSFCNNWWSHDSFSEIISLIIEIVIAGFFISIAFAYYRQCLDPTYSRSRAPQPVRDAQFPEHYNPPFVPYDNSTPAYAPPAGPPPEFGKPPVYEGGGYGVGNRDMKDANGSDEALSRSLKGDDPFADFDTPRKPGAGESRDTLV